MRQPKDDSWDEVVRWGLEYEKERAEVLYGDPYRTFWRWLKGLWLKGLQ